MLYLTTMYVYCVYPAMSKKSENLSDLNKKDRNKRHSSPFINVVKGCLLRGPRYISTSFILVCALPLYIATGYQESLFVGWKVYSSSTNTAKIYSYSIFVQQMYWLQDKMKFRSFHLIPIFKNSLKNLKF